MSLKPLVHTYGNCVRQLSQTKKKHLLAFMTEWVCAQRYDVGLRFSFASIPGDHFLSASDCLKYTKTILKK